ncbi:polyphosphate kinase 1 [Caniella muris]|uniref:polyphosphate kinase 1 n=1 Tax=Caniella muris TaxID=2941502 RepID=UPI00203DAEFA|nr:polyphosphate kinase 1 [Caniella muris]
MAKTPKDKKLKKQGHKHPKKKAKKDMRDRKAAGGPKGGGDAAALRAYAKNASHKSHEKSRKARAGDAPRQVRDYSYTQNREVSWLRFDDRVLTEALTPEVPLFERLKFCAIFQSNLDEWFMIRVGGLSTMEGLKNPPRDNKSDLTPAQQLDALFSLLPDLLGRQEEAFHAIERQLERFGLERVSVGDFDDRDNVCVGRHFERVLMPVLSPLVVDPRHPFPNLRNGQLYVMCALDAGEEGELLGMVEVPPNAGRVVALPSAADRYRYALVEDVIVQGLAHSDVFGDMVPTKCAVVRVTRNADIDPDGEGVEEEEDYRQHMKKILRRRLRLDPVRVEFQGHLGEGLEELVREELGLSRERVSFLDMPLDLSYVYGLESRLPARHRAALLFDPFEPQPSPMVDGGRPVRDQVMDHDVLLYFPYESMNPFLNLVRQAAEDDECIAIRITLYRVATRSRLCESLIAAAENGKDVTVLMELRARFDEKNNIEWAERLSQAGCTVIYGSEGYKCHSKICQITYHGADGIRRITCLGTGNFNEKTARLYSDFMLLTADKAIGEDGNAFFRNLTLGNLHGSYRHLGVAPSGLKPLIMRGLDREIGRARSGRRGRVFMKMNSFTDRDVIDKVAEAVQAGVSVTLVVRGICCILPGIHDRTEGLEIRQVVGRLLEHSRVYAFGEHADTLYLSSADMMTRNTERRVEIAFPVLDPVCRELVVEYMDLQLSDNVKARRLTAGGTWDPIEVEADEPLVNSQEVLMALACHHAMAKMGTDGRGAPLSPELASLPPDVIRRLISLYAGYGARRVPDVASSVEAEPPTADPVVEDEVLARAVTDGAVALADAVAAVEPGGAPPGNPDSSAPDGTAGAEAPAAPDEVPAEATVEGADGGDAPTTIVRRPPGRVATALSLIGLGLRTLVMGPEAAQAAQAKADRKNEREQRRRERRRREGR